MRWWTTRVALARDRRAIQVELLESCVKRWGRNVLHLFDRGNASTPWLGRLIEHGARFVMRWPKGCKLTLDDPSDARAAWKLLRAKPSWSRKRLWDMHTHSHRSYGVIATGVRHPEYPEQRIWLVASRPGRGRPPLYLLTNESGANANDAWKVVRGYMRRWQVETTFRYSKRELAMESPRLWFWDNRMKLLMIVALAYAFLLHVIKTMPEVVTWILEFWCHRTGKRSREISTPLYRARSALSRLWLAHPPSLIPLLSSG